MNDSAVHRIEQLPPTLPQGLSSEEAATRLAEHGPNDPTSTKHADTALELLRLFLNPLVSILLIASLASFLLGDEADATLILVIVLLSVSINFIQTYRSERAILNLREKVTLRATVLRDGKWAEIKRREVVPGDIVRVSAGDLIPADGQLVESRDLYVQQAALTGESLPAEKDARGANNNTARGPEAPSMVFLGTSVVSGTGTIVILRTGSKTEFGAIAERLSARPEETEFERSMKHFGMLITHAVFFLVLFIVIVRMAMHKDAFESFVFAVALAVGLTPEFLPMISSVTLARGAIRMARDQVVVKHLSAIQNFGTIDVLCSDKTGTLTTGQMLLAASVDCLGKKSDRPLELGYLNSKFETGIRSPLDRAILSAESPNKEVYIKCDELPFDFERRRLSILLEHKDTQRRLLITKGAPEGILGICESCEVGGKFLLVDPDIRKRARQAFDNLSQQGFRVLAVAYREVEEHISFTTADERSLVLAGYLSFADPPSPDATASLAAMKRDGVDIKILTGDNELVARHLCEQVGLTNPAITLGDELEKMTDPALQHLAEETTVFARVSPMQKHRVIHALKHRGHVVGYMGDGINDAPICVTRNR